MKNITNPLTTNPSSYFVWNTDSLKRKIFAPYSAFTLLMLATTAIAGSAFSSAVLASPALDPQVYKHPILKIVNQPDDRVSSAGSGDNSKQETRDRDRDQDKRKPAKTDHSDHSDHSDHRHGHNFIQYGQQHGPASGSVNIVHKNAGPINSARSKSVKKNEDHIKSDRILSGNKNHVIIRHQRDIVQHGGFRPAFRGHERVYYRPSWIKIDDFTSRHRKVSSPVIKLDRQVTGIEIQGIKRPLRILDAYIEFGNGKLVRAPELEGVLIPGERVNVAFRNERFVRNVHLRIDPRDDKRAYAQLNALVSR